MNIQLVIVLLGFRLNFGADLTGPIRLGIRKHVGIVPTSKRPARRHSPSPSLIQLIAFSDRFDPPLYSSRWSLFFRLQRYIVLLVIEFLPIDSELILLDHFFAGSRKFWSLQMASLLNASHFAIFGAKVVFFAGLSCILVRIANYMIYYFFFDIEGTCAVLFDSASFPKVRLQQSSCSYSAGTISPNSVGQRFSWGLVFYSRVLLMLLFFVIKISYFVTFVYSG